MFFVIFSLCVFCRLQSCNLRCNILTVPIYVLCYLQSVCILSCSLWCNVNNNIYTFFAILLFTVSNSQSLGGSQCTASAVADEDPQHGAL